MVVVATSLANDYFIFAPRLDHEVVPEVEGPTEPTVRLRDRTALTDKATVKGTPSGERKLSEMRYISAATGSCGEDREMCGRPLQRASLASLTG